MPMPRAVGSASVTSRRRSGCARRSRRSGPRWRAAAWILPQPEGPSSTRNSPSWTCRSRPLMTLVAAEADARLDLTPAHFTALAAMPRRTSGRRRSRRPGHGRGQDGGGHVDVVEAFARHGVDEVVELHGHRFGVAAGEGEAHDVVVPDAGDLHDGRDDQDGRGHRQHQLEEDAPEAAAVDARGLEQLLRQAGVVVANSRVITGIANTRCTSTMPGRLLKSPAAAISLTSG